MTSQNILSLSLSLLSNIHFTFNISPPTSVSNLFGTWLMEVDKKTNPNEKKEGVVVPPKDADFMNTATKGLDMEYNTWKTLIQTPRPNLGTLKSFICSHPQWPSIDELVKKVEEQLAFQQGETELLIYLEKHS